MDKSNPLMEQMTVLRAEANALGTSDDIAKREKDMEDLKHLQLAEEKQDRIDRNVRAFVAAKIVASAGMPITNDKLIRSGYDLAILSEVERTRRLEASNDQR